MTLALCLTYGHLHCIVRTVQLGTKGGRIGFPSLEAYHAEYILNEINKVRDLLSDRDES